MNPAEALDETLLEFMHQRGFDLREELPAKLRTDHEYLAEYHLIVSLDHNAAQQIPRVPFHTVLLEWDVSGCPDPDAEPQAQVLELERLYKEIAPRVRELLETLRGEEAS